MGKGLYEFACQSLYGEKEKLKKAVHAVVDMFKGGVAAQGHNQGGGVDIGGRH